jgi:hypothetical protein
MRERRAELRMLCADLVQVYWKDRSGRSRRTVANLEDISHSGVCLQMERPLPQETRVKISHPKGEFEGSVRYCMFREIGYFIGVQFSPGHTWSQKEYKPQHLLDLRRLVDRKTGKTEKIQ